AVGVGEMVHLQVTGEGGVPDSGVSAVVLNVTVTAPSVAGFLTVFGDETTRPTASNLNFAKGQTVPNLVIAPVGANGKVALYNGSGGSMQVIADVAGWFLDNTAVVTPPGPVTGVTANPAGTSIALSWTNPTEASLTGVMIRRAVGPTPPATATSGTRVADMAKTATSYTNTGLTSGTQYSYSLFAHDGTPVYASAATTTATTAPAGSGGISGFVTDAGGTHGLAGVVVNVTAYSLADLVTATTSADGSYTVSGLAAGNHYTVCFAAAGATGGSSDTTGYINQCYDNQPTSHTRTPVTVAAGATTPGINAALAVAGAISGTVTDAAGSHHGLANVLVYALSSSNRDSQQVTTGADGSYVLTGLPAGSGYAVYFEDLGATGGSSDARGYFDQTWQNQPTSGTPTPVSVTNGTTTFGINAALVGAAAMSGSVTDAGGTHHGLANVSVDVYSVSADRSWNVTTAADGSYVVKGLVAASDYEVCFSTGSSGATGGSSDALGYLDQCWQNKPTSGAPTPVTVTSGVTRTGINAALAVAGAVSGSVTEAGGTRHGLANVSVYVNSLSTGEFGFATTASDGSYTATGLPAGTDYEVCFSTAFSDAAGGSSDAFGYLDQCYNNKPTTGTPTPVTVTTGVNRTAINAALAAAGAVSGTLTDAGGTYNGLANVRVSVLSLATGDGGYGQTAVDGSYTVTGLAPGTDYQVCFDPSSATGGSSDAFGYVEQCYDNQPASGTPTRVTVTAGANTAGIGAALIGGGAISGTLTDAGGSHAGWGWEVSVHSASTGASVSVAGETNPGDYTVSGLPAATDYEVCFRAYSFSAYGDYIEYVDQCYNNQPVSGTPTPVTVTRGETTTGINAVLAPPVAPLLAAPGSMSLPTVLSSSGSTR
ncbi:MAG: hypothetical protein ABI903_09935, partial [Actinomycetota bacterium]